MKEIYAQNVIRHKPWKKAVCVLLSIILAFGTLVSLTVGSSRLQDWLGMKTMLSAYAAEIVDTRDATAVNEEAMRSDSTLIDLENKDGSNTVYLFSEPISYTDENGNLKTKDISVEKQSDKTLKSKGYEYTNGQNDYRINFSQDIEKGVMVSFDGCEYTIVPQTPYISAAGEEKTSSVQEDLFETFEYNGAFGAQTNLKFYPQLNGIKDEIVLDSNIAQNVFSFKLTTKNCQAVLNEDATVSLISRENKESVQTFSAPFAYDSEYVEGDKNEHYIDCEYTLEELDGNTYILSVIVDRQWLESESTVYPVTIDPTTSNISNTKDAGVYGKYPNNNYGNEQLCCFGYSKDYAKGRVYSQFTLPSAIKKGATINSAYQWEREATGRTTATKVIAYLVTESWSETGVVWSKLPKYNKNYASNKRTISSKSTDKADSPYWYKFNIKNIVNEWINGSSKNNGIVFRSDEEDELNYNWRAFASRTHSTSSYRPYTVINYTNDTIAPTMTVTQTPTAWTNGDVKVNITNPKDAGGSGLHSLAFSYSTTSGSYSWGTAKTKTYKTNGKVYVSVRDVAGNIRSYTQSITNIDKLKPNAPTVSGYGGEESEDAVKVTVKASDAAATAQYGSSGVKYYGYSKGSTTIPGQWTAVDKVNTASTFSFGASGTYYLFAKDQAGNVSAKGTALTVKIAPPKAPLLAPEFYEDNNLVGIYNPNGEMGSVQYKIGDNGTWTDYEQPFAVTSETAVNVYAKIDGCSEIVKKSFVSNAKNILSAYKEEAKDLTVTNNDAQFSFERFYNSNKNEWYFSTQSKVTPENSTNIYKAVMPDATELTFIKSADGTYENEQTGYTLSVGNNIIIDADDINYIFGKTDGRLRSVKDSYAHSIEFVYTNSALSAVTTTENEETRTYTVVETNGKLKSVTTPLGEELVYKYDDNNNLVSVYYNKSSLNYGRENDIILSEYAYADNKLTSSNQSQIEYNGSVLASITAPTGEQTTYSFSKAMFNSYGVETAETDFEVIEVKTNDDIVCFNYALLPVLSISGDSAVVYKYNGTEEESETEYKKNADGSYTKVDDASDESTAAQETAENSGETDGGETDDSAAQPENTKYTYYDDGETVKTETVTETQDGVTTTTVTEYDEQGNIQKETVTEQGEKTSTQTVTEFDLKGNVTKEVVTSTDENEKTTVTTTLNTYYADEKTETTTVTTVEDGKTTKEVTSYTYDAYGNVSSTDVSSSNESENTLSHGIYNYEYDKLNRTVKTTLENKIDNTTSVIEENVYNPVNNVIYQKTDEGVTRTIYDDYSRVVQEITSEDYSADDDSIAGKEDSYADKNVGARYFYAENGNLSKEINRLDVTTYYQYYEKSSVVKTESFDSYVYSYNRQGQVTTVKCSGQLYATYEYDENANNTRVVYGNGQIVNYDYDESNNLVACRRNDEQTPYITMAYTKTEDEVTYLSSKTDYECGRVTYYDKDGSITSIQTTDGETVFTKSVTESGETDETKEVSVSQSLFHSSVNSKYTKDNAEYTNKVSTLSVSASETEDSATTKVAFNSVNRLTETYEYADGKLAKKTTKADDGKVDYVETLAYDEQGRIIKVGEGRYTREFEYKNNRLVRDRYPGTSAEYELQYTYDSRGNLKSSKKYGLNGEGEVNYSRVEEDTTYEYNKAGDLTLEDTVSSLQDVDFGFDVEYDINGNPLKYKIQDYDFYKFEWTNGRQLKKISIINEEDPTNSEWIDIAEYTYDENGIKTSVKAEGKTTYFIYEGNTLLGQYTDNDGTIENAMQFLYDENGEIQGVQHNGRMYYYQKDIMGNVYTIRNASGGSSGAYKYEAYGHNFFGYDGNDPFRNINPIKYRGYYYDSYYGGYYNLSRYYNPGMGRFLNLDDPMIALQSKSDPDGMNLYTYCNNDPVNNVDYDGYKGKSVSTTIADKGLYMLLTKSQVNNMTTKSRSSSTFKKDKIYCISQYYARHTWFYNESYSIITYGAKRSEWYNFMDRFKKGAKKLNIPNKIIRSSSFLKIAAAVLKKSKSQVKTFLGIVGCIYDFLIQTVNGVLDKIEKNIRNMKNSSYYVFNLYAICSVNTWFSHQSYVYYAYTPKVSALVGMGL